jgi:hypothetical protein
MRVRLALVDSTETRIGSGAACFLSPARVVRKGAEVTLARPCFLVAATRDHFGEGCVEPFPASSIQRRRRRVKMRSRTGQGVWGERGGWCSQRLLLRTSRPLTTSRVQQPRRPYTPTKSG